ncbi:CPSF-domain protein [Novymonas esmeraldas]|uniref:CPSF-domain protein n=1 Tax=Novymonas esmeraldas TaxID=1808958 RepID=A0AAW0EMU2_9TRYP
MYVVSTTRPPAAAFGAAVGNFCGGDSAYVAVNRGTLLSVYACRQDNSGIDHLHDFYMHGTLKYVCAIPVADAAAPHTLARHLLFLCTVKQQIVLVALERTLDTSTDASPLRMTTLFQSEPDTCLYQYDPGEVELCCCTSAAAAASPPLVAFALTRGELFVFDVFAALARDAVKRRQSSHLTRLFSPDTVASVTRRAKVDVFSRCYMDCTEYDVKDMTFGCVSTPFRGLPPHAITAPQRAASAAAGAAAAASMKGDAALSSSSALYLLYADPHGKVHVSEYELTSLPMSATDVAGESSSVGGPVRPPARLPLPAAGSAGPVQRVRRCGLVQPNVDPTATRIVASRHGLFVVGNHLVTLVHQLRPRKSVFSREIPSRHGIVDVGCAAVSTDASELVIGFSDGVLARVAVVPGSAASDDAELEFRFLSQPAPTVPTEVVALRADLYLVCSRFDSSFTVHLENVSCERVLHNCGPVLDMTAHHSGARCSVVASTGIQRGGGVSVLRSAVMLREQASVLLRCHPQRILCAGGLLCVAAATATANRFFRVSVPALTLDELPPHLFPELLSRHVLVEVGCDAAPDHLTLVSTRGIAWLRFLPARCEVVAEQPRRADEADVLFAVVRRGLTILCDGAAVSVYRGRELAYTVPSPTDVAVSALSLVSATLMAVGYWDGSVVLYELGRRRADAAGRLVLNSVPRSIVCVADSPLLYIGRLDGFLVETTTELLRRGEARRSVFVAARPLELQELGGPQPGLLCLGDAPLVVLCGAGGEAQLTGLHLMGVTAAATVDAGLQCHAMYSRRDGRLHIGFLEALEKTSRTFLPLGETITQLHETPAWGGYAVAVRKVEGDEVLFLPAAVVEAPWSADLAAWRAAAAPLLENERCVFLETVRLGGAEGGERTGAMSSEAEEEEWPPLLLVGSSFTFPDEQRARSGRITWFALRESHQRQRLHLIASKDIGGALQCCAAVPNYKGRIALGVNGCVCLYKWNREDATFVAEERCRVGLTVTKLIPVHNTRLAASVLVALDVRYSAFFIEVDTLQGSLRVLCRDAHLRGVMDGHVSPDGDDLCLFDDNLNFTALSVVPLPPAEAADGGAAQPAAAAPQYRFEVRAQYHMGDLVTCVRQGTFAAASLMDPPASVMPPLASLEPRLRLPGVDGPQLIFATAHGGFGVVTPVCAATYLVLRALEVSLERVVQPLAGLPHRGFRDVLRTGQERGVSYLASETGCALARERLGGSAAFNTVDGDTVERFVRLHPQEKRHVCRAATDAFLHAFARCVDEAGRFVAPPARQEQCDLGAPGTPLPPFVDQRNETVALANTFLQEGGLPPLPFAAEALEQQLVNLQRLH